MASQGVLRRHPARPHHSHARKYMDYIVGEDPRVVSPWSVPADDRRHACYGAPSVHWRPEVSAVPTPSPETVPAPKPQRARRAGIAELVAADARFADQHSAVGGDGRHWRLVRQC